MDTTANSGAINKDHWAKRFLVGSLILIAGGALVYVSATMNYRFGYSLGRTPEDALLYAQFSCAADTLKVLLPVVILWAFRERLTSIAWGGILAVSICTAWGMTGSAGHLASNRLDVASQRAVKADSYKDLRADKERMVKQLEAWTAAVNRPSDAIKAEIAGAKIGNRMWTTTNGCTADVGTRDRREFCQSFQKLEADLGTAMKREEYQRKLEEVTAKLDKATEGENANTIGASEADPQATILNRLTAGIIGVPMWQVIMAILGVAVLELGGLTVPTIGLTYMFGVSVRAIDRKPDDNTAPSAATSTLAAATVPTPLALTGPGVGTAPPAPQQEVAQIATPPLVGEAIGEGSAGPAKPTSSPQPVPNPFLDSQPIPGSEPLLRSINFPFDERPTGPQKIKDAPKDAARRFAAVCKAYGKTGGFWADEISALYAQFCQADHREQTSMRDVYSALQNTRGVEYAKVRINPGTENKAARYTIAPARYSKPAKTSEPANDTPPPEVGADKGRPFSVASQVAANDAAPLKPPLRIVPRRTPFLAEQERWALVAEAAESRRMKAELRGQSRKQRGSRMHKRAA